MEKEKILFFSEIEDEILDLIDNANEMTRSDLQGVVSVLVRRLAEKVEKFRGEK